MFKNNQDRIICHSNSSDNNKHLIKSKSITISLNEAEVTKEVIDDLTTGEKRFLCYENRVNSITFESEDEVHSSNCDPSDSDDCSRRESFKVEKDGSSQISALSVLNEDSGNKRFSSKNEIDDNECHSDLMLQQLKAVDKTQTTAEIISSSRSSSSNENNNEMVLEKTNEGLRNQFVRDDEERKLLNVSHGRIINPFSKYLLDDELDTLENEIGDKRNQKVEGTIKCSSSSRSKTRQTDGSWRDEDESFYAEDFEGFDKITVDPEAQHPTIGPYRNETDININDRSFISKSAIPTCSFQRQDYNRPPETVDVAVKSDAKGQAKLFNLSRKSCNWFTIPLFAKTKDKSIPSLKHANLHYPDKTSKTPSVSNDRNFHTRAKYQLIKLGQKCKVLTLERAGSGHHVRTTVIKTNTNHRKKYQHYNEINKSYRLDDFIRTTHLLSGIAEHNPNHNDVETNNGGFQHPHAERRNSVIYKSYKSEIDLTRNLTYLDAFLNEHFERERSAIKTSEKPFKLENNSCQNSHKRVKSCSKDINYLKNVAQHGQTAPMINDLHFDESIDGDYSDSQFLGGNVTSTSFEFSAVNERKSRKLKQEMVNDMVKLHTTSSSFSSDYASVYSGGSRESRAGANSEVEKLLSTPEEFYNCDPTLQKKQKRLQLRRLSQPIPEHLEGNDGSNFLLSEEASFAELKTNMSNVYNSVPQFEDTDFNENFPYHYGCRVLKNPDAIGSALREKPKLSASFNERNVHHQDYLEHFQEQMLSHDDNERTSSDFTIGNLYINGEISKSSKAQMCDTDRFSQNPPTKSIIPLGLTHRIFVSKCNTQKGELVLEYEC